MNQMVIFLVSMQAIAHLWCRSVQELVRHILSLTKLLKIVQELELYDGRTASLERCFHSSVSAAKPFACSKARVCAASAQGILGEEIDPSG